MTMKMTMKINNPTNVAAMSDAEICRLVVHIARRGETATAKDVWAYAFEINQPRAMAIGRVTVEHLQEELFYFCAGERSADDIMKILNSLP